MIIKVLGPGCTNCKNLERVTNTGKNVEVPDEFAGIRQKSQELNR